MRQRTGWSKSDDKFWNDRSDLSKWTTFKDGPFSGNFPVGPKRSIRFSTEICVFLTLWKTPLISIPVYYNIFKVLLFSRAKKLLCICSPTGKTLLANCLNILAPYRWRLEKLGDTILEGQGENAPNGLMLYQPNFITYFLAALE